MSNEAWLFIAFLTVWAGIGIYLLSIGSRQRRIERRLEEIERRDRS